MTWEGTPSLRFARNKCSIEFARKKDIIFFNLPRLRWLVINVPASYSEPIFSSAPHTNSLKKNWWKKSAAKSEYCRRNNMWEFNIDGRANSPELDSIDEKNKKSHCWENFYVAKIEYWSNNTFTRMRIYIYKNLIYNLCKHINIYLYIHVYMLLFWLRNLLA